MCSGEATSITKKKIFFTKDDSLNLDILTKKCWSKMIEINLKNNVSPVLHMKQDDDLLV